MFVAEKGFARVAMLGGCNAWLPLPPAPAYPTPSRPSFPSRPVFASSLSVGPARPPHSLARGPRPNPNPNPGSCVVGGVAKSPQCVIPPSFVDLSVSPPVRLCASDRQNHLAL